MLKPYPLQKKTERAAFFTCFSNWITNQMPAEMDIAALARRVRTSACGRILIRVCRRVETSAMGVIDENENVVVSPLPRKLPVPMRRSSLGAIPDGGEEEEEDTFDDREILNRFAAQRSGPRRRQSYAGHRSTPVVEIPGFQRGRRLSEGSLMRPQLSPASKRDRELRKVIDDMQMGSMRAEQEIVQSRRDLETIGSQNHSIGKRIDRLIDAAADMRSSHRHVFTGRYSTEGEHSQLYNRGHSLYQRNKERKVSASQKVY